MEIDLHALELRFAGLRVTRVDRLRRLRASIAEVGQQTPVVVVAGGGDRHVLIDGYLRVEALKTLRRDVVTAVVWPLAESEALIQRQLLAGQSRCIVEEAWLLTHLRDDGFTAETLAQRFGRTTSWVSRRLALVTALPRFVEELVRGGVVPPQAAMKSLVPLARANKRDCAALVRAIGEERLSVRDYARLYAGYRRADKLGKQALVTAPLLFLRADVASGMSARETSLVTDLETLGAIARRAIRRIEEGVLVVEQMVAASALRHAWDAADRAHVRLRVLLEEARDAGPRSATSDLHPQGQGAGNPSHRASALDLADDRESGARERLFAGAVEGDALEAGRAPGPHP